MIYQRKGQRHRSSFMCNVSSKLLTVCKNNQLTKSWDNAKKKPQTTPTRKKVTQLISQNPCIENYGHPTSDIITTVRGIITVATVQQMRI